MEYKQYFTYDEFFTMLWSSISANVISEQYLLENEDFIQSYTFDLYRLYELDSNLSLPTIRRIVESTFFGLFRFKPSLSNIVN